MEDGSIAGQGGGWGSAGAAGNDPRGSAGGAGEPPAHRAHLVSGVRLALRPAEVRADGDLRATTEQPLDRGESRTDAEVVRDTQRPVRGLLERDVATKAALGRAHITVNKNAIPNDPEKPAVTSGVRIGSPAMTTRGFRKAEAESLAHLIADALDRPSDDTNLARVAGEIRALCARFPVYA